jgi:hypothetical protein
MQADIDVITTALWFYFSKTKSYSIDWFIPGGLFRMHTLAILVP